MKYSPLISDLIDSLRHLPGVGAKSAQRMAFHLLERNREGALTLSEALAAAMAMCSTVVNAGRLLRGYLSYLCR